MLACEERCGERCEGCSGKCGKVSWGVGRWGRCVGV